MPSRHIITVATLSLMFGAAGCVGSVKDTGSAAAASTSDVDGIVFKGPMSAGGLVTITPVDERLQPIGDPVEVDVAADDGDYSATVEHYGVVLIEAEGPALDEAKGEEGDVVIALRGYALLTEDAESVQINLVTDLTGNRVEALVATGSTPAEAIAQAEAELFASVPIGDGTPPDSSGRDTLPYSDGYDAAWLFALSGVVAAAGDAFEDAGLGDVGTLIATLREDFADDGAFNEDNIDLLHKTEASMDPDLATLGLSYVVDGVGAGWTLPDIHQALDTDQDGVLNADDNCRYVANSDQSDSLGLGFGDDCDYRLTSIATNDTWGCGLLLSDGTPVCWDTDAEPTGGTPPAPDVFPAHAKTPWEGEDKLGGAYGQIDIASGFTCAVELGGGDVVCDVDGVPDELVLAGDYIRVRLGGDVICALDSVGLLDCVTTDGELLVDSEGPYLDMSIGGDGEIAVLDRYGELSWLDYDGGPDAPYALPDGSWDQVTISESPWGCSLGDEDHALSCFGTDEIADLAPEGSFAEVAVGEAIGCVTDDHGLLQCWRDESVCEPAGKMPEALWAIKAGGCQVCGLDVDGIGRCWPRYWDQTHPE